MDIVQLEHTIGFSWPLNGEAKKFIHGLSRKAHKKARNVRKPAEKEKRKEEKYPVGCINTEREITHLSNQRTQECHFNNKLRT